VKMPTVLLVLLILIAAAILVALIGVLGFWMEGAEAIALPGLGLLIATRLIVALLVTLEIGVVVLAAYLLRYTPIVRLGSWMTFRK
jgi:hypothetical protein